MEAEMTLRPMTLTERNYSYTQSQQLIMQTGCIGHLRADFGSNGKQFFSSWDDHRADLKSDAFKHEFDEVINTMREDSKYGGILKSRRDMTDYCYDHPISGFEGNYTKEYGFRVDTDHYSYMLRLSPNKGDYNIYCYCYLRQWLDRHMRQAEKGIRFITPDYKDVFRIPDGDKIRMILPSGEKEDLTCRYVDECHLEVGRNLYHICEFAERMKDNGITVIPLRSSLPDKCFSYLESTGEMIVITKGEPGYTLTGIYPQDATPKEGVTAVNEANGVTRAQEAAMVAGSMFGWHVPDADPKNYDDQGQPIRPKARERDDSR